jgi:hypothetical protein
MRNLLGRLNARTDQELARIAAAWNILVTARDRHTMAGQLYREMRDPRTLRDSWATLPEDEKGVVRLLAVTEHAPEVSVTIPELAQLLELDADAARQIATRLYQKGILAREGDSEPRSAGELPRLFLPRELALLFRRVQDDIEAGDISGTPLRVLLSLLEDWEIEQAAERWGYRIIPGLRTRDEITDQLLEIVTIDERVDRATGQLKRDARIIWEELRKRSDEPRVQLADLLESVGMSVADAQSAHRARHALSELEEALLVWHTYDNQGERWLFIPMELRTPHTGPTVSIEPPATVPAESITLPPWRHPDRLAWDMLTLLRAIDAPGAPRIRHIADAPKPWLRRLNRDLWNRGADLPIEGYLEFLIALGRSEGVIAGGDPHGDAALERGPALRTWRSRSFTDQTARLTWWWLASSSWIEAIGRDGIEIWGATWPPFRRKLVALLATLKTDAWYSIPELSHWLAARDLDMLGDTVRIAIARPIDPSADDAVRRRAALAAVIEETLTTSFTWLGLVELGLIPRQQGALRVSSTVQALAETRAVDNEHKEKSEGIAITPDHRIELVAPIPIRVWSLSAFAETVELSRCSQYRVTEASIRTALAAGFDLDDIEHFLRAQSGNELPQPMWEEMASWVRGYRRLRLHRMVEIIPDDPGLQEEIIRIAHEMGWELVHEKERIIVAMPPANRREGDAEEAEARLFALLRQHDFAPQWQSPPPSRDSSPDRVDGDTRR